MIGYEKYGIGNILWDSGKCICAAWRNGYGWTASNGQNTVKSKTMAGAVKSLKRAYKATGLITITPDEAKELLNRNNEQ